MKILGRGGGGGGINAIDILYLKTSLWSSTIYGGAVIPKQPAVTRQTLGLKDESNKYESVLLFIP